MIGRALYSQRFTRPSGISGLKWYAMNAAAKNSASATKGLIRISMRYT